jgi:hypothetical protein
MNKKVEQERTLIALDPALLLFKRGIMVRFLFGFVQEIALEDGSCFL